MIDTHINDSDTLLLHGIIPEIETAFVSAEGRLLYWSLTDETLKEEVLEFDKEVLSIGIAIPPTKFFELSN